MPEPEQNDELAVAEIRKGLAMLYRAGDIVEVRVPRKHDAEFSPNISGFFTDLDLLAGVINEINKNYKSTVYTTLNPVKPSWMDANNKVYVGSSNMKNEMDRAGLALEPRMKKSVMWESGRIHWAMRMAEDEDILKRRWILIDIDAGQPSGTNSSDEEHANTLAMAKAVREFLISRGFPEVALTNSGNGHHCYSRVDLENTAESAFLIRRFLLALAQRFNGQFGKAAIDTAMFNAGRITKATGTVVYKGPHSEERPNRRSAVLEFASRKFATLEQIEEIAAEYSFKPGQNLAAFLRDGSALGDEALEERLEDVHQFFDFYDLDYKDVRENDTDLIIPAECPNAESHTMNGGEMEAVVMISKTGSLSFCCQHAHCTHLRSWRGLEEFMKDKTGNSFGWCGQRLSLDGKHIAGPFNLVVPGAEPTQYEKAVTLLRGLPDNVPVQEARAQAAAAGINERTLRLAYFDADREFVRTKSADVLAIRKIE